MRAITANNLVCPIDGNHLTRQAHSLICDRGHNFDIARQGYLNLLVVQHKASRDPGDTKEMVAARRRLLDTGCYEPIATSIANLAAEHLSSMPSPRVTILDAGCGEGYYLDRLLQLSEQWISPIEVALIGLDISKWAIQSAAKRSDRITWIVGSNRRPPFALGSIDLIICAFGFPSFEIFRTILKPWGKIILVDPAPDHLIEMRQLIYPELRQRELQSIESDRTQGFQLIDRRNLTFKSQVSQSGAVQDLFAMTPHYFRSPPEGKATIAGLDRLEFTVDLNLRVLALEAISRKG